MLESSHEELILAYSETGQEPSLQYSKCVSEKIACAFIASLKIDDWEKVVLAKKYKKYIDAAFSVDKETISKSKKMELSSEYFKGSIAKVIELLNTIIKNSVKIARDIGLYGIYEYMAEI